MNSVMRIEAVEMRNKLSDLVTRNGAEVAELMDEFGYALEPSVEALELILLIEGERLSSFSDELFVIHNYQEEKAGVKYAAFTGGIEGYSTPQKKNAWEIGISILKGAGTVAGMLEKKPAKPAVDESLYEVETEIKNPPKSKEIFGLPKAVAIALAVVVVLFVALLILTRKK